MTMLIIKEIKAWRASLSAVLTHVATATIAGMERVGVAKLSRNIQFPGAETE